MKVLDLAYKPLPVFSGFHDSPARVRCVIGGLGSGKTTALCWEIIRLCMSQPGLDAMLLRRFVPALRDSTEAAFFEALPDELAAASVIRRQGGHYESIRFPNGSLLKFRGCEDWEQHKGQELGLVAFDEVDEVPEATAVGLLSRLRQSVLLGGHKMPPGRKVPNHMLMASNPRGQNWVWSAFVQENSPTHWPDSSVHLSTALDNPYLPPEYIDMLLSRPANYVRRFVYALADDEPVLTPGGWLPMGSLREGMSVVGSDGTPTRIVAVHPQGPQPLFDVELVDGSVVRCTGDHRWQVDRYRAPGAGNTHGQLVVTSSELRRGDRLPPLAPVEPPDPVAPLLDPYVLGVLLGDGSLKQSYRIVELAANDEELVDYVREALGGVRTIAENTSVRTSRAWYVRHREAPQVRSAVTAYGLGGCGSLEKFLPVDCMFWRAEDRAALLCGLMDTDGSSSGSSNHYTTISPRLSSGVADLARSLGCRVTVRTASSKQMKKSGETCHDRFDVSISPPAGLSLFRLSRKLSKQHTNRRQRPAGRYVRSVSPAESGAATCITVAAEDGLFVVRDYVLTHNCEFDRSNGAAYPEWGWDSHVLPSQPPGYYGDRVWMGMDPGVMDPTAGLWAEVDRHRGRLVAVAEYQEEGRAAPEHASAWRKVERAFAPVKVVRRVADPSISKRDPGTTMELADIYQRLGYTFERGPVRAEIRTPALANIIATGQFVGTEACPRLHDQIMRSSWEDQVPRLRDLGEFREKLKKGGDHIHDCAQYLATLHVAPLRAINPEAAPPPKTGDEIIDLWNKERMAKMAVSARARLNPKIAPREGEIW